MRCPYCGLEQSVLADNWNFQVVTCDPTERGCDRLFTYRTVLIVDSVVKKIEGEEDKACG